MRPITQKLFHAGAYLFTAFLIFILSNGNAFAEKSNLPNIVILLADDLGYGDLACYGGKSNTPNLDNLASQGLKFTSCYSGAPLCSPSRVSLLTGRIPARSGMYSYRDPGSVMHLPANEITLAEMLKEKGYQTAHFGKWHLSCLPNDTKLNHPQPDQQGFDYSFGTENNALPSHLNPTNFVRNGVPLGMIKGYSCQIVADEVNSWFKSNYKNDKPFFLYVAFHEPHKKIASPPELIAKYPNEDHKRAEYLANVENLDLAVGRIRKMLAEKGLDENTLVFFSSDNGPLPPGSTEGLRAEKSWLYEGGIRVPGIVSYPPIVKKAKLVETPIWFPDWFPTIASILGEKVKTDREYDGMNIMPLLEGKSIKRDKAMMWFFYRMIPEVAVRKGDYVILAGTKDDFPRTHPLVDVDQDFIKGFTSEFFELYNLKKDVGERNNLINTKSAKAEKMKALFNQKFYGMHKNLPYWEGLTKYDAKNAKHNKLKEFQNHQKSYLGE